MRWPLTPYGARELTVGTMLLAGACVAVLCLLPWWLVVVPAVLWVFLVSFFRDPVRVPPDGDDVVVSPADGCVADVEEVAEGDFLGCPAVRVGIFMSLFNVHVNRAPLSGTVGFREHRPGKFHNAMLPEASRENECLLLGVERADGLRYLVKQVAGLVARRIVCEPAVGSAVVRGERYGMVKFGSRLEVYVPVSTGFEASVSVGDRVRAGSSALGTLGSTGGGDGS